MLERFLYYLGRISSFQWVCVALVFVLAIVQSRKKYVKKEITLPETVSRAVLFPYLLLVLIATIFIRLPNNEFGFELVPFWSYREIIQNNDINLLVENLCNIIIFVPFGFVLPLCKIEIKGKEIKAKETILCGLAFSFGIEIIQLISKFGYFEFDDIFNNVLGVLIGLAVLCIFRLFVRIINKDKKGETK